MPGAPTSAHHAIRHEEPNTTSLPERGEVSDFWRDAQAGVPSTKRPRAQLAFKYSMVHGILQFTPGIAFCYVLHRCESRDIRCRESCGLYIIAARAQPDRPATPPSKAISVFLDAFGAVGSFAAPPHPDEGRGPWPSRSPKAWKTRSRSVLFKGHDNDPSAGSPTETLLRLLLPLNDKVQWTSRDVGGGEPPPSPRSEHFTGPFNR